MGKGGGFALGLFGMILTLTGIPALQVLGVGLMTGGAIWSGIEQRREMQRALDQMRKEGEFGLKANTRTTQRAIPLVFGETRVGGNIVYMGTGGMRNPAPNVVVNNQDLYLIFGVSEGPIDSFREMYFNELKVWDIQSGNLQTPFRDSFLFDYRLGVSSQAPYTQVNSIDLDFSETYPDVATAMVRLQYNRAIFQSIPAVTFLVRGIKCFDPATPGDGRKWTFNPAHVLYNLMTDKRYGWGVASARINHSSFVAVGSIAGQKLTAFSDQVTELIETTAVGPREFNDPVYIGKGITATSFNVTSLRSGFDLGGAVWPSFWSDANPSRFPVRPGSLCIGTQPETYLWLTPNNVFYYWYAANAFHDSPTSGDNSQYGFIVVSGTSTNVGSVDYFTGWVNINTFTEVPWAWNYGSFPVRWFANYGGTHRTQYQYLARSVEVWCGSEVLVEVASSYVGSGWYWGTPSGTIYLASNSGGAGTIDHQQGIVNFYFGTAEWYNNEPVYIKYKLGAEVTDFPVTRFSFHGMISNADPGLDVMRDVCQHMRGFLVYVNGQYKLKCDFPGSTVYDFDDDNILAGTFRVNKAPLMERPSRIRVKFVDALAGYTVSEIKYDVGTPDVLAQTRREQTLVLMGCKYRDFAVRVGGTLANQVLWNTSVEFGTTLDAAALEPGDLVTVTHPAASWTSKAFRIVGISEEKDSTLEVSAVEHDDAMYTDLWIGGGLKTPSPSAYPQRPPNISLVTSLGVSEFSRTLADGTMQPFIKIIPYVSASAGLVPNLRVMGMYDGNNQPHQVLYEGPFKSPIEYGPVVPGNWHLTAYSLNEYMVPWPVPVNGGIEVLGLPEYEWQQWRLRQVGHADKEWWAKSHVIETFYGTIFAAYQEQQFGGIRFGNLIGAYPSSYTSVESTYGIPVNLCLVPNSGDCISVFWCRQYQQATQVYYGATYTKSFTCVTSPTITSSPFVGGLYEGMVFETVSGQVIQVGWTTQWVPGSTTPRAWNIGFGVMSMGNLWVQSYATLFSAMSHHIIENGVGLTAFSTQSKVVIGLKGFRSNSGYSTLLWTYTHSMAVITSAYLIGSEGTFYGGGGWTAFRGAGIHDEMCFFTTNKRVLHVNCYTSGSAIYSLWFTTVDIRSITATVSQAVPDIRWFANKEDQWDMTHGWYYGMYLNKPHVSGDSATLTTLNAKFGPYSVFVDVDFYRYWKVTSYIPQMAYTWNWT